jgi:hypothetical protein
MKHARTLLASAMAVGATGLTAMADNQSSNLSVFAMTQAGEGVRMEYELEASAWLLIIPITGKASFNVEMRPNKTYEINSRVRTTGLADVLVDYDMRLGASGYLRGDMLSTYSYVSQNNDGKKNRRVELIYGDSDVDMTANPRFGSLGEPPATPAQKLEAKDPITALISYALEPRGDTPEALCGRTMKIFDGRQLTHLSMSYVKTEKVRAKAWKGQAVACDISMDRVAGYEADEINRDTLTGIDGPLRMWLAPMPNGSYVPVKIQADTDDIGKVTLQASKLRFSPL